MVIKNDLQTGEPDGEKIRQLNSKPRRLDNMMPIQQPMQVPSLIFLRLNACLKHLILEKHKIELFFVHNQNVTTSE